MPADYFISKFWVEPRPTLPPGSVVIYALLEPFTGTIRYIGATSRWPFERYMEHLQAAVGVGRPTCTTAWVQELMARGLTPEMRLLEAVEEALAGEREGWHIQQHRTTVLNVTGLPMPAAQREAIRAGTTGIKHRSSPKTPEHRARIGEGVRAAARRRNGS